MALPTHSFTTYDAKGDREDLSDVIYLIDPVDTPFLSSIDATDATATKHEWQTDSLAAASDSNAALEGDEAATDAATATARLDNVCQIQDKVPRVTGTQETVVKAGRRSEMEYQVWKRAKELKRDMEKTALANQAKNAGTKTESRKLASVLAWLKTNTHRGTGGADPKGDGSNARTDGAQRAFDEAMLKKALKQAWESGGDPDCLMLGSFNKQKVSAFTGNATRHKGAEDRTLVAAIDVYDSDFGELHIVPNRFQRPRDALVIQKDMWAASYLRPFRLLDLARTGDSERKQLLVEWTLEARNEAASALVADLTTS